MNPEEYANIMDNAALQQQMGMSNQQAQQQLLFQEQERGLAAEQLDVEEIIDRIYNLLQGKEYKEIGNGIKEWVEPDDNSGKTLSEFGVQRIMQVVRFHINKNTLLSNFDERQINNIMYRFTTELNDLFYLKYAKLLREPTFEECKNKFEEKLKREEKLRAFTFEVLGKPVDMVEINKQVLREMEGRIEKEMEKIKNEELNERIKEYGIILWEIEQAVLSTFNRAFMGKERETLRRHAQFSEVRAISPEPQKKGGAFGFLKV